MGTPAEVAGRDTRDPPRVQRGERDGRQLSIRAERLRQSRDEVFTYSASEILPGGQEP
jgi:hypothetical protein